MSEKRVKKGICANFVDAGLSALRRRDLHKGNIKGIDLRVIARIWTKARPRTRYTRRYHKCDKRTLLVFSGT